MDIREFSMELFSLKGKTAIVTGGNNGVGMGYVMAFMRAGANVLVPCLNQNNWVELEKFAAQSDVGICLMEGDLTDEKFRDAVINRCVDEYQAIDILVNNAGFIIRKPLLECEDDDFSKVMQINCDALYFLSRKAVRIMLKRGHGKIINIASMISFRGGMNNIGYSASKHAVAGITKNFANELGQYNIQVNAIAPGYIAAGNSEEIIHNKEVYEDFLSRIPAGRWGRASDLQGLAVFLASPASDYINGTIIPVDGGYLNR